MAWYEMIVQSKIDIGEDLTTFFIINGIDDLLIEDDNIIQELKKTGMNWDYLDENLQSKKNDFIIYKAHYEGELKEAKEILARVKKSIEEIGHNIEVSIVEIDPNEGLDNWKEYFKPFEICKNIIICPSWETYESKENEKIISIDPGSAFGTGTHETTSLCAEFLSEYVKEGDKLLDIGSGSGILSIIAIYCGAEFVKAVDVDEMAMNATLENAEKNGLKYKIIVDSADNDYGKNYDIIVSNLTSPILIELSTRIDKACDKGTYLLTSGILTNGKDEVIKCYKDLGFELLEDRSKGEWTGLILKK